LIPISPLNQEHHHEEFEADIEKLTVNQLKSRLSDLGLKVSGKKSELVIRLKQSLESTKERFVELTSKETEEENVIEEIVISNSRIVEQPSEGNFTPNLKMRYALNWLNRSFFGYYIVLSLSVMGIFSSLEFLEELEFLGDRFIQDYGGMDEIWQSSLQLQTAIVLIFIAFFYLFGRVKFAITMSVLLASSSLILRLFFALESDTMNQFALIEALVDFVSLTIFCVTSAIPWFFISDLENIRNQDYSNQIVGEPSKALMIDTHNTDLTDMDQFAVTRPSPPRRRRPMELFYEGIFLLISMILWPITISTHFLLALEIPTRYGSWDMETNAATLLLPLYLLSFLATWVVIRSDREARGGALYAKEKEAYHEFMDQFLALKKAYYERQAKRLDSDDSE